MRYAIRDMTSTLGSIKPMLRSAGSRSIEMLSGLLPKKGHVAVHGFPNDEGNAVEVVRALLRRYPGTIYWLIDDWKFWTISGEVDGLRIVPKGSLKGVMAYATAEVVFFTHGLYGACRPTRDQVFVNLWHGDGFKLNREVQAAKRPLHPAHYAVTGTRMLREQKALNFMMNAESILATGNPRIDQFSQGLPSDLRERISGSSGSPFVVWLPTFRRTAGKGATRGWSDVSKADETVINFGMQQIVDHLCMAGIRVVVKPHPLDKDPRRIQNAYQLDNADLGRAGATLYGLLGASAGLITDYSSVWTDYLTLDRPIGFYVPDLQDYRSTRGLSAQDAFDWAPGPLLHTKEGVQAFVDEIHGTSDGSASLRAHAVAKLGIVREGPASDRLLDELSRRGAFSKVGALLYSDASRSREIPDVLIHAR